MCEEEHSFVFLKSEQKRNVRKMIKINEIRHKQLILFNLQS